MSNKTSDKNVANIEDDVKILDKFCEYESSVVLIDGALIEVQDAIQNILAEREQKDKRIKKLEEENVIQRRQLNSAFDNGYILHTYKIRKLIANETIDISGFKCIAVEDLEELLEDK